MKTPTRTVILICGLMVAAASTYLMHRFQTDRLARSVDKQAAEAANEGDFQKAATLYAQHLAVAPADIETQLKYTTALLEGSPRLSSSPSRSRSSMRFLEQYPGRYDVRRRRAELTFSLGSIQ